MSRQLTVNPLIHGMETMKIKSSRCGSFFTIKIMATSADESSVHETTYFVNRRPKLAEFGKVLQKAATEIAVLIAGGKK